MNIIRGRGTFHRRCGVGIAYPAAAIVFLAALFFRFEACAEEIAKAPVPKSPFITAVYRYADAMLEHGRDNVGAQKTGLLLSALDRQTLAPLANRPAPPAGVHEEERAGAKGRALTGANPQHDENLLRLLYMLSELSGKPKYREAADAELKWLLQNMSSPATLAWSAHISWDVVEDKPIFADDAPAGVRAFFRPWLLWDRCFDLVPDASKRLALGLWEQQNANRATGVSDREARLAKPAVKEGNGAPRDAGFYLRAWAVAYAQTKDAQFVQAIEGLLARLQNPGQSTTVPAGGDPSARAISSSLSLAIDCDGAAHRVPEPLASKLRALAARNDEAFCALPHALNATGGFLQFDTVGGEKQATPLWSVREGVNTTAQIGMMCVSRYENSGKTAYRDLIHAAADVYLKSMPDAGEELWPVTIGHAISLQLAAWRSTARQVYFDRARMLGDFALEKFFDQGPLPRAGLQCDHYETITGADTLTLALAELHLEILHITAVRYPPNTIDR